MTTAANAFDVVIIGSGISALTAAALLAKRGKSVCVLESHTKPGGYMHCFSRFGQRFDTGAHYVGAMGPGQAFRTLLEYLGVYRDDLFVPLDPEAFDIFRFPKAEIRFPQGHAAVIAELSAHFPAEKAAVREIFAFMQEAVRTFPTYDFDPEPKPGALSASAVMDVSLAEVVRRHTRDPALQSALYAHCVLHGTMPEDVPFGLHALMMDSFVTGAHGFRQGGDAVTASFVAVIERAGGRVLTRSRVTRLRVADRQVREVVTEAGEVYRAEWVISAIHPKALLRMLEGESALTPAFKERVAGLRESYGMFGIYANLSAGSPIDPKRNYYYFASDHSEDFLDYGSPGHAPVVFAAAADRNLAPGADGLPVSLHLASPIAWFEEWRSSRFGKRPAPYAELKEQLAEGALRLVARYHPGFRGHVRKYVTSTPLSNLHYNGSEDGSAYGLYHSVQNAGARALGPRTKILNLLLTGQNSLFPGLQGAAISGLRTSGHILGIKPILAELHAHRATAAGRAGGARAAEIHA